MKASEMLQSVCLGLIAGVLVYNTLINFMGPKGPPVTYTSFKVHSDESDFRPGGHIKVSFEGIKFRDDCRGHYSVRLVNQLDANQIILRDAPDILPPGPVEGVRQYAIPLRTPPGKYKVAAPSEYECQEGNYTVYIPPDPSNLFEIQHRPRGY